MLSLKEELSGVEHILSTGNVMENRVLVCSKSHSGLCLDDLMQSKSTNELS